MLKPLSAIAPAGGVQTSVRDLARWLTFHATRSPELLGEGMWRELHRPQAEMPAPTEPEVQHPHYALGWIHESYRRHPLVVHNGAIDGPITDGAPQVTVRFSKQKNGEPLKLFVPLNFDEGDPVQVFTRVK